MVPVLRKLRQKNWWSSEAWGWLGSTVKFYLKKIPTNLKPSWHILGWFDNGCGVTNNSKSGRGIKTINLASLCLNTHSLRSCLKTIPFYKKDHCYSVTVHGSDFSQTPTSSFRIYQRPFMLTQLNLPCWRSEDGEEWRGTAWLLDNGSTQLSTLLMLLPPILHPFGFSAPDN